MNTGEGWENLIYIPRRFELQVCQLIFLPSPPPPPRMLSINPERLQLLTIWVLINHLPSIIFEKKIFYLGGFEICRDILRVTALYGKEKRRGLEWTRRFNNYHSNLIMDMITFMIIPSSVLVFPPSKYIPTLNQLRNYLSYHGNDLIELSLAACCDDDSDECYYDVLLEIIGATCSSKLKRLTLPVFSCCCCCITDRGVNAITKSEFSHTLQELDLSSSIFANWDVLFELLSHLPSLKKLNISNVTTLLGSDHRHQILPVPLNNHSLSNLEHLNMCSINGGPVDNNQIAREWGLFFEQYSRLKTLQVANTFSTLDVESLCIFKDCLQKRKEPLAYLRIRAYSDTWFNSVVRVDNSSRYPAIAIIRQMNADNISAGETFDELYRELQREDVNKFTRINIIHSLEVVRMFGSIMRVDIDEVLSAIDLLIPEYRYIREVFGECSNAIFFMAEEMRLAPSVIEAFITLAMGPENEDFCLARICDILSIYKQSISVGVFEKVLTTIIKQDKMSNAFKGDKISKYIADIPSYCPYEYILVIKRVVLAEEILKKNMFGIEVTRKFIIDLKQRENFLLLVSASE